MPAARDVPDRFAIDSHVYIRSLRDRDTLEQLKAFLRRGGLRVLVAGVVGAELRAGASTPEQVDALEALLDAYTWRGRVFGTSFQACWEAGRVLAAIASKQKRSTGFPHHLANDAMLAASCRQAEAVLITGNTRDFAAIQRHLRGFRFVSPWPLI